MTWRKELADEHQKINDMVDHALKTLETTPDLAASELELIAHPFRCFLHTILELRANRIPMDDLYVGICHLVANEVGHCIELVARDFETARAMTTAIMVRVHGELLTHLESIYKGEPDAADTTEETIKH